jgi:hypothetical protein
MTLVVKYRPDSFDWLEAAPDLSAISIALPRHLVAEAAEHAPDVAMRRAPLGIAAHDVGKIPLDLRFCSTRCRVAAHRERRTDTVARQRALR